MKILQYGVQVSKKQSCCKGNGLQKGKMDMQGLQEIALVLQGVVLHSPALSIIV